MKPFLKSVFALSVVALSFTRCANTGNLLKLDHTNFTEEIATDQNLSFSFTSDLVPDSLLQQWDTTQYISFSPAVRGKFKWNSPKELIFSPSETFAPSTDFTAQLTKNLFNHSKRKLQLPKEKAVKFHTPYLLMANAQL